MFVNLNDLELKYLRCGDLDLLISLMVDWSLLGDMRPEMDPRLEVIYLT